MDNFSIVIQCNVQLSPQQVEIPQQVLSCLILSAVSARDDTWFSQCKEHKNVSCNVIYRYKENGFHD